VTTLAERFRRWLHDLTAPGDREPELDVEYLISQSFDRMHMTTIGTANDPDSDPRVRCDLCGRLFEIEAIEDAIEHVADHDGQGQADIDPFEPAPVKAWAENSGTLNSMSEVPARSVYSGADGYSDIDEKRLEEFQWEIHQDEVQEEQQ